MAVQNDNHMTPNLIPYMPEMTEIARRMILYKTASVVAQYQHAHEIDNSTTGMIPVIKHLRIPSSPIMVMIVFCFR